MSITQYLVYLFGGAFLLVATVTVFVLVIPFSFFALMLLFLPLFLVGYTSGLSFFYPRISAVASVALVLPYFGIGVHDFFDGAVAYNPTIFIAPATVIVSVSVIALLRNKTSLWSRQKQTFPKIIICLFAGIPALLVTFRLVSSLLLFRGFYW